MIAFVAPRDGADAVIAAQLQQFAQTVQTRLLGDCMSSDGFAAPTFPMVGPPTDLGNPQFPNLPAIEATNDLGLFTGAGPNFDPHGGMSAPERKAWQARIERCFRRTQRQNVLFGSPKFGPLTSHWYTIVNQISGSSQIRKLSRKAATSIGVLAAAAIASGNHWTPVMNSTLVIAAPFLGVAVGVLAGSYPAIRAARITPMATLRS